MKRQRSVVLFVTVLTFCWALSAGAVDRGGDQLLDAMREEIAAKGYTFQVGPNPATRYTIDELCGLQVPPGWWQDAPTQPMAIDPLSLPSSYDWRNYGGVSAVKNQGSCGSCWAFGTVGVMESLIMINGGLEEDLSEQYLVSCNDEGWGCNGGWFAHDYHINDGAVYESCRPYTASDAACQCACSHPYKLNSWYYVAASNSVPSTDALKNAIYNYGPLAVAVYVDTNFQYYTGGIFNGNASGQVNHAVILVGWNDSGGYWIMKNSWGTGWGESGYMRIAYGSQQIGYAATYVVGYQSGNWPPDTDCDGGCNGVITESTEALDSLGQLKADFPDNELVVTVDAMSRNHREEIQGIMARNPMIRHLTQRGLWTNLGAIQAVTEGTDDAGRLNLSDFMRAAKMARQLASRGLAADLDKVLALLQTAHGKPAAEVFR